MPACVLCAAFIPHDRDRLPGEKVDSYSYHPHGQPEDVRYVHAYCMPQLMASWRALTTAPPSP